METILIHCLSQPSFYFGPPVLRFWHVHEMHVGRLEQLDLFQHILSGHIVNKKSQKVNFHLGQAIKMFKLNIVDFVSQPHCSFQKSPKGWE